MSAALSYEFIGFGDTKVKFVGFVCVREVCGTRR
jgi:hypothetical protein